MYYLYLTKGPIDVWNSDGTDTNARGRLLSQPGLTRQMFGKVADAPYPHQIPWSLSTIVIVRSH
jgi:hypothetical protein